MSVAISILIMLGILSAAVVVHEFGHYIAARICKIRVTEFAIGMGPKLWSKQGKQTLFSIRALPIGGFCAMGEDQQRDGEPEESSEEVKTELSYDPNDAEHFNNHPKLHRVFVLAFGSIMNVLLGFVILLIISFFTQTR